MGIVVTLILGMILLALFKVFFDWVGVPKPFNWLLLALGFAFVVYYAIKHPILI